MIIKTAKFITSVADSRNLLEISSPEIAVAGKSNVGKSSFINFIVNQNRLAKTSSEPGRTRLLNYFEINSGEFYFIDLPGYGYARAAKEEKEKWGAMIEGYLQKSPNLKNVFLLLDIRHTPTSDDLLLITYLNHYGIPYTVIATKCDKLSKMQIAKQRNILASTVLLGIENVICVSSEKKTGKPEVLNRIEQIIEN